MACIYCYGSKIVAGAADGRLFPHNYYRVCLTCYRQVRQDSLN